MAVSVMVQRTPPQWKGKAFRPRADSGEVSFVFRFSSICLAFLQQCVEPVQSSLAQRGWVATTKQTS